MGRTGGAQAPVDDLGLVDGVAVVVGRGETGRLPDRTVDIGDDTARPACDVVVIIPDPSLEPGRAARRFETAYQPGRGERVQRIVHGLQGNVADAIAYPGRDGLDAEVITLPHGVEQGHADGRYPQASPSQLGGGGGRLGSGHGVTLPG